MEQLSLQEAVKAQQHDVSSSKLTSKNDSKGKAQDQTELESKPKITSKIDSKGKAKNQTELKSKSKPKIKRERLTEAETFELAVKAGRIEFWRGDMALRTPRERKKYQGKVPLDWFDGRGKLRARHIAERLRESQRAASGGSVTQGSVPAVGARVRGGDGETEDDAGEEPNCDVGEMEE